ncbi:putative Mucin-5B-like 5 [Homarus americanus]|uniref:Putative Mucin-5B-like 5 n=1 Tax=Homarus americanus TaxID=6706 RepID=A0A8J5JJN6_HOMAM|nr:putative Mucin-5B-like 5 [Homarus americanus]
MTTGRLLLQRHPGGSRPGGVQPQLVGNNGKILPHFLRDPGTNHCCCECVEGAELSGHCTRKGWLPIDDCCVHDEPHFFTFEGHRYDWHCNYSLAQTDMTYDPEAGVFGDFEPCFGDLPASDTPPSRAINTPVNGDPYTVAVIGGGTSPAFI